MGRFYSGDINGKFWFGTQSSEDASFFGGEVSEPNVLNYFFSKDDLPTITKGIDECLKKLGENKVKLDKFFGKGGEGEQGYNDEMLVKADIGTTETIKDLQEWYARLELGEKILKCVKKQGECNFEAEC